MIRIRQSIERRRVAYDGVIADAIRKGARDEVIAELIKEKERWLCRNDLFYLAEVTGNDLICKWGEFYRPFCDRVSLMNWRLVDLGIQGYSEDMLRVEEVTDDWKKDLGFYKRLFLCYRAFYKTTIVTKLHSLQLLLNFPDIVFVLCHNKQVNASDNLVAVKNYFLSTRVGRLFSEYVPAGKDWGNMSGFNLANRKDYSKTEDNIEAIGVDTEVVGRHWMLAKKNDLVTEKSVNTEEQIKKTAKWDELFNQGLFCDPQIPLQDYEGTRYHFADLYSELEDVPGIEVIKMPLVRDLNRFLEGDDNEITHRERFTRQGIIGMMRDPWVFNCQHMLNPQDPGTKRFTPDMVEYYDDLPDNLTYVLVVDPANEKKKRSDYTAMGVIGISLTKYYIVDLIRDKLGPDERIEKAIELIKRYGIKTVGWEKVGLMNDTFYLEERRIKEGLYFSITEIKAQMQAKVDRIRDILVPQYANGQWVWPKPGTLMYFSQFEKKTVDMVKELELEMMQFPNGKHDDMLDIQTFLPHMSVIRPREEVEQKKEGLTFGDYVRQTEARRNAPRDPYKSLTFTGRI